MPGVTMAVDASQLYFGPFSTPSWGRYLVVPCRFPFSGLGCSRAFIWFFSKFSASFSITAGRALRWSPIGKFWQSDRINFTGLNEWCRQKKKQGVGSQSLMPNANSSSFLIQYLFSKILQSSYREISLYIFNNNKIFLTLKKIVLRRI